MNLRFSRQAADDLETIGDFIAKGNPGRAISFVEELQSHCTVLLDNPAAYPLHPELGADLRASVYGKYLIFFKVIGDELLIVRILHGARDLAKVLNL